jgi:hypothetical protein
MEVEGGARFLMSEVPPNLYALFVQSWPLPKRPRDLGLRWRDWYFIAEQPAPAPRLAHPEGCAALRIVLLTVPCVSRLR